MGDVCRYVKEQCFRRLVDWIYQKFKHQAKPETIYRQLKIKAQNFRWERKKENYAVIAKHIADKEQLTKQGHLILDLDDFEPSEIILK